MGDKMRDKTNEPVKELKGSDRTGSGTQGRTGTG